MGEWVGGLWVWVWEGWCRLRACSQSPPGARPPRARLLCLVRCATITAPQLPASPSVCAHPGHPACRSRRDQGKSGSCPPLPALACPLATPHPPLTYTTSPAVQPAHAPARSPAPNPAPLGKRESKTPHHTPPHATSPHGPTTPPLTTTHPPGGNAPSTPTPPHPTPLNSPPNPPHTHPTHPCHPPTW